jgi:hypothetical protein
MPSIRNIEFSVGNQTNTVSGASVVKEKMYDGTSSASKMGADRGGFKFPSWTPPKQAPLFMGRGMSGGGGMNMSRLNR